MTAHDLSKGGAAASPAVAYITARLADVTLPDIVSMMSAILIGLQIVYLIWKWRRAATRKDEAD